MKRREILAWGILCSGFVAVLPAMADELPQDVKAYANRRAGCNYWPSEHSQALVRKTEIQRHIRELRCNTLDHDEAVLNARYAGKSDVLNAIAEAHDAMPD